MKLPVKLLKAPLVEAVFEVRFKSRIASIGDLLPGLIYSRFGDEFSESEPLPVVNIPKQVRDNDSRIRYQPMHKLQGGNRSIQVGDHVVSFSQHPPYEGWDVFSKKIFQLLDMIKDTRLLTDIERFSFRVINIIPVDVLESQLNCINASFEINHKKLSEDGFRLRTEVKEDRFLNVIQIATGAKYKSPNVEEISGLLIDIDTIREMNQEDFWVNYQPLLENAHEKIKKIFFSLLTDATIERLEPIMEDAT